MMALDNNYLLFPQQPLPLLDWDPHSHYFGLGVGDVHDLNNNSMAPLGMDSPISSEEPSGYLQDAVAQWKCKRRRVASVPCDVMFMTGDIQDLLQGFWDSACHEDPMGSFNCFPEETSNISGGSSGESFQYSTSQVLQNGLPSPPSSSQKEPKPETSEKKENQHSRESVTSLKALMSLKDKELEQQEQEKKRRMTKKVVYPFAMLKPVGLKGDATLADINERIHMRPTRPVKHPVGKFALGPCVSSAHEPGLSGKVVVGLTRIHTSGRGTITIIRTRG